jgi:hypothetical protein
LNLIKKTPENDVEGEEASAAVVAGRSAGEQCLGDVGEEGRGGEKRGEEVFTSFS